MTRLDEAQRLFAEAMTGPGPAWRQAVRRLEDEATWRGMMADRRPDLVEARARVTRELEWLVAEFAEAVSDPDAQGDLAGWERWTDELEGALAELRSLRRAAVEEAEHGNG